MNRRNFVLSAAAAVLLASPWGQAAEKPPVPKAAPNANTLVQAYNARNFGSPGWRRIYLELKNHGKVTRTFTILHLWRQQAGEVRSLVLLEDPVNLRGTNYLLAESGRQEGSGMALSLFLPSGKRRVLTIKPSRFDEGLLGSDFSYSDLRWTIPEHGLTLAGSTKMLGRPVWAIDGRPANREGGSWSRIRYYIARDPLILLGADYFRDGQQSPFKRLRIQGIKRIDGVWTPTAMVMSLTRNRSSVLTLKEVGFGAARYAEDLFDSEHLPAYGDRLRSGRAVVELPQGVRP